MPYIDKFKNQKKNKGDEKNNKSSNYHTHINSKISKKKKKQSIPFKLRQQVWLNTNGKQYECKCFVKWCSNTIDVFNYQVGHDIPESKGGTLHLNNLKPICSNCNLSMSNNFSITQWNNLIDYKKINNVHNENKLNNIDNENNKNVINILENNKNNCNNICKNNIINNNYKNYLTYFYPMKLFKYFDLLFNK